MESDRRLIEVAFPLKQASLDSVREKYGPRGHISGFHLWPARRPLAACRAALIATLLPDPGDPDERREILERLAGRVVTQAKTRKLPDGRVEEITEEETRGGILRWGRESSPGLDWFREKIRAAYDGRAPKVLDPFAGGGAIPLEAMRLGCEATAVDINPVAWFILKCTLEYPQRLAGQTRPLPDFVLQDRDFMAAFFKAQGFKGANLEAQLEKVGLGENATTLRLPGLPADANLEADLAWHVRAWGKWVLERARADLERFYPTVDGQPTVAYLWARTVTCKNCRATLPLLKTAWLAKRGKKRVALTLEPNAERTGVVFGIQHSPPRGKDVGQGTMSRAGATCPCCGAIMTMSDIRLEGKAGRLGAVMTAVVVEGEKGKVYRLPAQRERERADEAAAALDRVFAEIPFGIPDEPLPGKEALGFRVPLYGFDKWYKLFIPRQLLALGTFVQHTRAVREVMEMEGYPEEWVEAVGAYLATSLDRLVDHSTSLATWYLAGENVKHTFVRYALPITWDFAESNTVYEGGGSWSSAVTFSSAALEHSLEATAGSPAPTVTQASAITHKVSSPFDLIVTDPPYYDAIPYSDLMDCFYVWLKRSTHGLGPSFERFSTVELSPKWDRDVNDGELIDDSSRHKGDKAESRAAYENGMFRAFQSCYQALKPDGRLVIVFAHKQPDAWETLASAMIKAGFVVSASWPIQTENITRSRARASAALASSVWLVCRKRPVTAHPGWDNRVLAEMREKITTRLHDFWDAGIRGPDFVWAATGPALEAYSRYPVVKKANEPGQHMAVSEFLRHVRRIVVDFVVGRVLSGNGDAEGVSGLDDVTTYYLLHRHDFGMEDAPAGAVILYAISCNLSDRELADRHRVLEQRGSTVRLLSWSRRQGVGRDPALDSPEARAGVSAMPLPGFDLPEPELREIPLIDQVHRLMHLWKAGDVTQVELYLDVRGLRRSNLFHQLLQALIELAPAGSEERALLESISNHVAARGDKVITLFD